MTKPALHLISFKICPFAQRSVIALKTKSIDFQLTYLIPNESPDWFKAVSPLGKVPVLLVDERPIFESAVILEYLDEVYAPQLHPQDPLLKAQHRAWIEFASDLTVRLHKVMIAQTEEALDVALVDLRQGIVRLESAVSSATPYFDGETFCLVDCVYAPIFMRLSLLKQLFGLDVALGARLSVWSDALLALEAVQTSVVPEFNVVLQQYLTAQQSYLVSRL